MSASWARVLLLPAVGVCLLTTQQAKSQPKASATAGGVFVGRSGKPMAKARVMLGELKILGGSPISLRLGPKPLAAVADGSGGFQFTGFTPGSRYAIVYQPAGAGAAAPAEINIKGLASFLVSFLPSLRGVEVGARGAPYPDRPWGNEFTLLKGHTLFCLQYGGSFMKIWNATVRCGANGPYLEYRKGEILQVQLDGKTPLKVDAWSY